MNPVSSYAANRPPSRLPQLAVLIAGPLFLSTTALEAAEPSGGAADLVQAALQAELSSDGERRTRLLDEALQADSNLSAARWARGEVRVGNAWKSLDAAAADARRRPDLQRYRDLRRQNSTDLQGQVTLAEFCRKHRLLLQEQAHWNAVLVLAPDHPQARHRLGFVNHGGTWVLESEIEQQKKTAEEATEYLRTNRKTLNRLAVSLANGTLPRDQVVEELKTFDSPCVIPALEQQFSSRGETGGLCVVAVLQSLAGTEASLSLVRHALGFPVESVRIAAADALQRRDEVTFIPPLLASLQSPVLTRDEFSFAPGNRVIWRQSLLVDRRDVQQAVTVDQVFTLQGVIPEAAALTANSTRGSIAARNLELDRLNAAIESYNGRVSALLARVTRVQSNQTPEDWWTWWNDRIESYPSEPKEVQTRYQQRHVYSLGTPRIPEPPPRASIPVSPRSSRLECLAPGTPVWTETGPVAIDLIKTGDLVLAQDARSGELRFAPVLAATNRPPELLLRLKLQGETVRSTGGHPFWVVGKGWIKARSLEPGMGLHTARGVVVLDSVEEESEPTRAFNLIVDDLHSYFVGSHLILSHDNTVRLPVVNRVPGLQEVAVAREE